MHLKNLKNIARNRMATTDVNKYTRLTAEVENLGLFCAGSILAAFLTLKCY